MAWVCGVEEAGRGPVIGPMVMACCWAREEDEELLVRAGVKDSKQLTPAQRRRAYERLAALRERGVIGFATRIIEPGKIDEAVLKEGDNLNKLELRVSAELIRKAQEKAGIRKAIIDCPAARTGAYAEGVRSLLKKRIAVAAEHKADERYPVVSAASIIAKVTRDELLRELEESLGVQIGSGYPADPKTRAFLERVHDREEYAPIIRRSWSTYQSLAERKKQRRLGEYAAKREGGHEEELREFEFLLQHGFTPEPVKGAYEVVRMRGRDATIIKYTTGKIVIQGKEKERVTRLLRQAKKRKEGGKRKKRGGERRARGALTG